MWCCRRLLTVPWAARRSTQSILKEMSPGCSLEELMLKLKLQSFGHLMQRADSFENANKKQFFNCIKNCLLLWLWHSVQFSSVAQSCLTLWDPMNRSTPGLPVHHQLPEFTQTHAHWVGDAIQASHLCHPLLLLPPTTPSIRVFSNKSTLHMRWPKYWSFSFNISPSNEHPGLISFRMDWLDLLAVQETLKSLLQHHSSKASIFRHSAVFTHPYMTTGKNIALTRWTFVGKVMSLLFNMLSRLVITFLPRSECLLISWLQSPSAGILEPQKIKVWHCFYCLPIYFPWGDGTRCYDLSFLNIKL